MALAGLARAMQGAGAACCLVNDAQAGETEMHLGPWHLVTLALSSLPSRCREKPS